MQAIGKTTLFVTLLLSSVPSTRAQAPGDPSGHWEGSIQAEGKAVKIEIDLARDAKGGITGTFSNPGQELKGLPLSNLAVEGSAISFQIKGSPGERAFKANLSGDGQSMSGDYSQSGYTVPFDLKRMGDARFEAPVKNPPVSRAMEGTWKGTLEADGKQLRAILTLSNQADGTASGKLVSVDEGLEIPISSIAQKGSDLTLVMKSVGGTFVGTLNAEASELAGTYTQRQIGLPLTFQRDTITEAKK